MKFSLVRSFSTTACILTLGACSSSDGIAPVDGSDIDMADGSGGLGNTGGEFDGNPGEPGTTGGGPATGTGGDLATGGDGPAEPGTGGAALTGPCDGTPASPGGYCVVGNQIFPVDGEAPVIFRGVNIGFLHDQLNGHHHTHVNEYIEARAWGSNIVRIPIDQTWWLANQGGSYRARLDEFIGWATQNDMAVIVDVHRSGGGNDEGKATQETLQFWETFAPLYKDNGQLLFELYNEPRGISDEELWRGGNGVAGIQQMYDAVRAAGADQLVIIGGNDWGYDLRGWNTYPLDAGHYNVVFSAHPYSYPGKDTVSEWEKDWGFLAASYPFILTEFGYAPNSEESTHLPYEQLVVDFCEQHGLGWTAWAWTDYFKNHSIFEPQSSYDPAKQVFAPLTAHGQLIKNALAQ